MMLLEMYRYKSLQDRKKVLPKVKLGESLFAPEKKNVEIMKYLNMNQVKQNKNKTHLTLRKQNGMVIFAKLFLQAA